MLIGFVINPIAGMGGRVGLKGTDGMYEEALKRGAEPVTPEKARKFLSTLHNYEKIDFLTASYEMGESIFNEFQFSYTVVYQAKGTTNSDDTKKACEEFMKRGAELIIFVGGDGTARDVVNVVGQKIPILGVPSGVKMYSSVFCVTPKSCAAVVEKFVNGEGKVKDGEVLDIDENAYRKNELKIKLYGFAKVPYYEDMVQSSKSEYGTEDEEDKEAIAEFFIENIEPNVLYILGAGTTTAKIAEMAKMEKTLLGVDAYYCGKRVGKDMSEKELLEIIEEYKKRKLVVTPIGSQGFVFGRGNQQLSERVLKKIGKENIIIVATPKKMSEIKKLRMDLDDCEFLKGYYKVLVGYGKYKMVKME